MREAAKHGGENTAAGYPTSDYKARTHTVFTCRVEAPQPCPLSQRRKTTSVRQRARRTLTAHLSPLRQPRTSGLKTTKNKNQDILNIPEN
ncbi:hypothetical protein E2C01_079238 [Portunus trituberculatus]|uniref:Uncharacterized protein n=1 Tax=Portunus trituberculatus TaxID=210409 RepID=A0A5B7IQX6_PORTR|nr:hypothetical protein [Portunus trituberculatus]